MWTPPPSHSAIRIPPAFLAFRSNTKYLKSNIAALAAFFLPFPRRFSDIKLLTSNISAFVAFPFLILPPAFNLFPLLIGKNLVKLPV